MRISDRLHQLGIVLPQPPRIPPGVVLPFDWVVGLIFLRETFEAWFTAKLAFVGALVTIHILTGLVIIRLFEAGNVYPVWRFAAVTATTVLVVAAILFIVLAKPDLPDLLPDAMSEPGALRRLVEPLNPFQK